MKLVFEKDSVLAKEYLNKRLALPYNKIKLQGNDLLGDLTIDKKELMEQLEPNSEAIYYLYETNEKNEFLEVLRIKNIKIAIESKTSLDNIMKKEIKNHLGVGLMFKHIEPVKKLLDYGYNVTNNYIVPKYKDHLTYKYKTTNNYLIIINPLTLDIEEMLDENKKMKQLLVPTGK